MRSYFSEGEYILADSGYASTEHIVPTFKRARSGPISPAQLHFNNAIAKLRVASEHCNGMLKGRFGSLKELRLILSDVRSAAHACAWIAVCIVIHNFLIVERLASGFGQEGQWEVEDEPPSAAAERSAERDSEVGGRRSSLYGDFVVQHDY